MLRKMFGRKREKLEDDDFIGIKYYYVSKKLGNKLERIFADYLREMPVFLFFTERQLMKVIVEVLKLCFATSCKS